MIRQSASLNCQTIWDYRPTVVTATLAMFQLNNVPSARKCQAQSRHHPRRRRKVCHVRLGTRPWYEAVVRKQVTDTPPGRRGVTAGRRRARRRRDSKESEAQRRAHPPSRPPGRPRRRHSARRHSARRHRRHERACSNQQHSRATTTRSRPNTAQSGPRTIWCALSRRGASEGRIGAVVVLVWVASAGAGWVVRRVDRTAVFVCRPKGAAYHTWGCVRLVRVRFAALLDEAVVGRVGSQRRGGRHQHSKHSASREAAGDTMSLAASVSVLWRCPTLPQPIGCSTIGAAGLSFQVRNVAGRFPGAVTTTRLFVQHAPPVLVGGVG